MDSDAAWLLAWRSVPPSSEPAGPDTPRCSPPGLEFASGQVKPRSEGKVSRRTGRGHDVDCTRPGADRAAHTMSTRRWHREGGRAQAAGIACFGPTKDAARSTIAALVFDNQSTCR